MNQSHLENRNKKLLKKGLTLEYITLFWNVIGVVVTLIAAFMAHSIAIGGFGLDSFIEIGASLIVVRELTRKENHSHSNPLKLLGLGFFLISIYIFIQVVYILLNGYHPDASYLGIIWTAITFFVMLALAKGKTVVGRKLGNPVLLTEGKVTLVDAYLAAAITLGLLLNAIFGWWWADPAAALIIVYYGLKEGKAAFREAGE